MYKRILIANRGEIALRIIRACKELGIETVAVYSTADRGSQYLDLADETYCIGPPKSINSYLKIDQIISASPEAMDSLGDKNRARAMARAAKVPVVPGSAGLIEDENEAVKVAREIGFPVLIKATAGGGGKGMRVA